MNAYEKQLQSAADQNVPVVENYYMGNDQEHEPIDGLYINGNIALSSDLDTTAKKAAVLAEELAHHALTVGDILDQSDASNRRQEQKARTLAYDRLIGVTGITNALEHGCRNRFEAAEYLGVPEDFLQDAIDRYQEIYGPDFASQISRPAEERVSTPVETTIKSATTKEPPAISDEEIQKALEQIRKRKKRYAAQWKRAMKRMEEKERDGYDFLAAEAERRLDPDR